MGALAMQMMQGTEWQRQKVVQGLGATFYGGTGEILGSKSLNDQAFQIQQMLSALNNLHSLLALPKRQHGKHAFSTR